MFLAQRGVDGLRITHERERSANAFCPSAAEQVRDAHGVILLQDLDAVAPEGRSNALAVEHLASSRLRNCMQARRERQHSNK